MRILHVISSLDRKAGGPPAALVGLAIAQAEAGLEVAVVSTFTEQSDRSFADELQQRGVSVTLVGPATGKLQRHPDLARVLPRLIATAEVVHIHTLWEEIQHQAARIARQYRVPYVFVPHGMLDPWSLSQNRWIKRAYLTWRLKKDLNGAAFIHVLNRDEGDLIQSLKLKTRFEIIPNGIAAGAWNALPPKESFREQFPQLGDAPYILFLSRLHHKKGLDFLADAWGLLNRSRPDVKLVVAGPDEGAREAFEAGIQSAGLSHSVLCVGPLYGQAKQAALAAADVFVLPSRQEGLSVATVEALASGLPVVITDSCHFPEVGESGAGTIVPLNAPAIAAALLDYLNDPARRFAASQAAKKLAKRFDWARIAQQTIHLYGRPKLTVLANALTPYRIALHRRIVSEIPDFSLHTLFTLSKSNAPWEIDPPAEIKPVSFAHLRTPQQQGGAIIRWLKQNRPKSVIVNGYNDFARLRILRWCRRHGVPVFLWGDSNIRGDRASGLKFIIKSMLVRWAIHQTAGVMPCGSLGQQYFEKYGANPRRIFWVPYEPDYDLIRNVSAEALAAVQEKHQLPPHRRRIVYSGRLIGIKRVDLVLAAFAAMAADRPDWDLVIIGDGPLKSDLQASVAPGLKSRITWTGFIDDQASVSAIYRSCQVLAHVPDIEPWALVINEAVAAGMAVVATNVVGAAAELVQDGVNGRLVPPGDLNAITQAFLDVTAADRIESYQAASGAMLDAWRLRADPVDGIRRALASVSLAPESVAAGPT